MEMQVYVVILHLSIHLLIIHITAEYHILRVNRRWPRANLQQ